MVIRSLYFRVHFILHEWTCCVRMLNVCNFPFACSENLVRMIIHVYISRLWWTCLDICSVMWQLVIFVSIIKHTVIIFFRCCSQKENSTSSEYICCLKSLNYFEIKFIECHIASYFAYLNVLLYIRICFIKLYQYWLLFLNDLFKFYWYFSDLTECLYNLVHVFG